jgi:predicted transcriptional regulator
MTSSINTCGQKIKGRSGVCNLTKKGRRVAEKLEKIEDVLVENS